MRLPLDRASHLRLAPCGPLCWWQQTLASCRAGPPPQGVQPGTTTSASCADLCTPSRGAMQSYSINKRVPSIAYIWRDNSNSL